MSTTLWHLCTPDKHKTDCAETIKLTAARPKTDSGKLLIEFHPPYGKDDEAGNQTVSAEDALRWPHIISYS